MLTDKNIEEQINHIEISMDEIKELVKTMDDVLKLTEDKRFKKIVREGYFRDEASRLALLKADDEMQGEANQDYITRALDAIGFFHKYLQVKIRLGRQAERDLESYQEEQARLLAEQAAENATKSVVEV